MSMQAAGRVRSWPGRWPRWPGWVVTFGGAALLVWLVVSSPPAPTDGTRRSAFHPEQLAATEQAAWEAYYLRQWPRLFWLMLQVMRDQFGLSWAQAVYAAAVNTQAQLIFARQGDQGGEAEARMRHFYSLVREPLGASYDVERAAAAELHWWVVHRNRHAYPDDTALVGAMTALYQEVYGVPAEQVRAAAEGRVRAVAASDRWLDQNMPVGSPLLVEVRDELASGYRALKAALGASTAAASASR